MAPSLETAAPPPTAWHRRHLPGAEFWLIHAIAALGVAWLGWSWRGFALAVGLYYARMLFVCMAYHRYFSHRTFRTSRPVQLVLAVLAQTTAQKGALWWASKHRVHHKESDGPGDVHSAKQRGLWWSHVGWIVDPRHDATEWAEIPDLARYPELVWLNQWKLLPAAALALACFAIGGAYGLVWGFLVSTVLLWHGTFTINSLSHLVGRRRYATDDDSRNNALLALLTLGEGWHNNHHHYQSTARQGFYWWEIDPPYYVLRLLEAVGVVWDVRRLPRSARERGRIDAPRPAAARATRPTAAATAMAAPMSELDELPEERATLAP